MHHVNSSESSNSISSIGAMKQRASTSINQQQQQQIDSATALDDVKVQIYYAGLIHVVYIDNTVAIAHLMAMLRHICQFDEQQLFTVKWVDEEGDPCTLSSQMELDEALRLYYVNKESELVVHVFANAPERPGTQCVGEDRSIYRRGARRWRKIYLVNGHKYQAKRFARTAMCKVCGDRIWGLGRQGYKCLECKIMVHKRCHKFIALKCADIVAHQHQQQQLQPPQQQQQQQQQHQQQQQQSQDSAPASPAQQQLSEAAKEAAATIKQAAKSAYQVQPTPTSSAISFTSNEAATKSIRQQQQQRSFGRPSSRATITRSGATTTNEPTPAAPSSAEQEVTAATNEATPAAGSSSNSSSGGKMGLEQFDLIKVIGRGSYAKVFLAEYKRTKKCYAMKVIKKSIVDDDEDIDWVQTEKHVFEQATNHPFLVGLHSCFQTESRLFFVIEYLCGGDLMYHMQRKRRLPEDHARFYAAEISVALGFLHSRGIIYRDLKLDNVLLDIDGHVKLTDYGMCKEGLTRGERTSTFCGTPNYIAPEMLRGEDYDFSVDWWALGVLMFEMMAGRSPFEPVNENPGDNPDLNTEDHLFQVILEKPIRIPRNLSVRAASVLKGFLQKAPGERLASHDGLAEIKQHLFFKPIDWHMLEQRLIQPPYKPPVQSERDLNNIDELFTREPVILTPDTPNTLARIQQNEFDGFEYINPLILSDDLPV